jgi:hypothetical protein
MYLFTAEKLVHEKEEAERNLEAERLERGALEQQICTLQVLLLAYLQCSSCKIKFNSKKV